MGCSLLGSTGKNSRRHFVDRGHMVERNLCRAGWRLELEGVGQYRRIGSPLLDAERVLRGADRFFAGNDVLAGDGAIAHLDPYLPVGVAIAEREVFAFDAIDDAAADIFR